MLIFEGQFSILINMIWKFSFQWQFVKSSKQCFRCLCIDCIPVPAIVCSETPPAPTSWSKWILSLNLKLWSTEAVCLKYCWWWIVLMMLRSYCFMDCFCASMKFVWRFLMESQRSSSVNFLILFFYLVTDYKKWRFGRAERTGFWHIWDCLPWKMEGNRCCYKANKKELFHWSFIRARKIGKLSSI